MRSLLSVRSIAGTAAVCGLIACGFHATDVTGDSGGGRLDGPVDSQTGTDGGSGVGMCPEGVHYCSDDGEALIACDVDTGVSTTTACDPWGCDSAGGAHCKSITPTGGFGSSGDTSDGSDRLLATTLPDNATIDPLTGEIQEGTELRGAGSGIIAGIDFELRDVGGLEAGVFRFGDLKVLGHLAIVSDGPSVVLISTGSNGIDVAGPIDAQGSCTANSAGPGGFAGGAVTTSASGSGAGSGSTHGAGGGVGAGGGGYGTSGGAGGNGGSFATPAGGGPFGDDAISLLIGGGGGGGGAGSGGDAVFGGGGGGGIQLVANTTLLVESTGSINAGGCGGASGKVAADSGGGGGAGGAILLEANQITISGKLAANGGGGGANLARNPTYARAAAGELGTMAAAGAIGYAANGGNGAAGSTAAQNGLANTYPPGSGTGLEYASGGGGGIGRIRLNSADGSAAVSSDPTVLSPPLSTSGTSTCTQGVADAR